MGSNISSAESVNPQPKARLNDGYEPTTKNTPGSHSWKFIEYYNYERPHMALNYSTPAEVYFRDVPNVLG
jgi:transposase InsO family protein